MAVQLHNGRSLAVSYQPQNKAAVFTACLLKDLGQGQVFQAQLLGRLGEGNLLLVVLKLPGQLEESLMHAVFAGHAEIGKPVIQPGACAHKADGHDVSTILGRMAHN